MSPLEASAMTDSSRLLASRFLALAEEIFARADRVHDADIREKIRAIAAGYERMAQLVEDQSAEGQRDVSHAGGRRLAPRSLAQSWKPLLRAAVRYGRGV
jgi:hypothetical protein